MLKIENLHVSYGGIRALRGISLEVPDGKIVTLIGANGAGKSTMLRTITGLVKAESGSIRWNDRELLGLPIDRIIGEGIAMTPAASGPNCHKSASRERRRKIRGTARRCR
jgi:ABC-type branched-chain amino acid transport systems, ATPase component